MAITTVHVAAWIILNTPDGPEVEKAGRTQAGGADDREAICLVGVNSDGDLARVKAAVEKEKITWPSFRDGGPFGSVAKAWNVDSWPTTYVLDPKGVIRYRNVRDQALSDAVEKLIRENE